MAKRPSLYHQLNRAVNHAFTPGQSKHDLEEHERKARIFSYEYRTKLNDFAHDFARTVKEKHPDIKLLQDIKPHHINEFLQEKHDEGCSDSYLKVLTSYASKLGSLSSDLYQRDINWTDDINTPKTPLKTPEKVKEINDITPQQWDTLKDYIEAKPCQSANAIRVAGAFGLRVSEITKLTPKDIKDNSIVIHKSKGGRSRELEIRTQEQRDSYEILRTISNDKDELQKLFTVQPDSINKFYKESAIASGIESSEQYGIHQLRRMAATDYYHELIKDGTDEADACNKVSNWLGHGDNRSDVIRLYVNKTRAT